jgi:hypothetical protein
MLLYWSLVEGRVGKSSGTSWVEDYRRKMLRNSWKWAWRRDLCHVIRKGRPSFDLFHGDECLISCDYRNRHKGRSSEFCLLWNGELLLKEQQQQVGVGGTKMSQDASSNRKETVTIPIWRFLGCEKDLEAKNLQLCIGLWREWHSSEPNVLWCKTNRFITTYTNLTDLQSHNIVFL